MDDSTKSRYNMILGRYLIGIRFKNYRSMCTAFMVNLGTYEFFFNDAGKITAKAYFMNAYVEEIFESENVCTSTK